MAYLGYLPDSAASALARGRSRIVAAILPTLMNSVYASTVHGLASVLRGVFPSFKPQVGIGHDHHVVPSPAQGLYPLAMSTRRIVNVAGNGGSAHELTALTSGRVSRASTASLSP